MLFVYDTENTADLQEEIAKARACESMLTQGLSQKSFRAAVRTLTHHNKLIVPTAIGQCTELVERMRTIAIKCEIEVVNLTAYLSQAKYQNSSNTPVAADAVPPTQQTAAAGQPIQHPPHHATAPPRLFRQH